MRTMLRMMICVITVSAIVLGCGGESEPATTVDSAPAAAGSAVTKYEIPMTTLDSVKIGAYDVFPMYEEDLKEGHFNIRITGGEVVAVREWVGPEDASGVVVVK